MLRTMLFLISLCEAVSENIQLNNCTENLCAWTSWKPWEACQLSGLQKQRRHFCCPQNVTKMSDCILKCNNELPRRILLKDYVRYRNCNPYLKMKYAIDYPRFTETAKLRKGPLMNISSIHNTTSTCISKWSTWINRDKPSKGKGDFEAMTDAEKAHFCPAGGSITNINCSTSHGIPSYSSGDIAICDFNSGFTCYNADNFPVVCQDYKISYYCDCPLGYDPSIFSKRLVCVTSWSVWINRDDPTSDDKELEAWTDTEQAKFCPGGKITKIECTTTDGIPSYSTGEIANCYPDSGFTCNNADNFPIPCSDYKIRYYCDCPTMPPTLDKSRGTTKRSVSGSTTLVRNTTSRPTSATMQPTLDRSRSTTKRSASESTTLVRNTTSRPTSACLNDCRLSAVDAINFRKCQNDSTCDSTTHFRVKSNTGHRAYRRNADIDHLPAILGSTSAAIVVGTCTCCIIFVIYKWRENEKKKKRTAPGESDVVE